MKNDYSQLLIDVQKKSNITVADIKDIKYLKEEIEFVTNKKISFNTLRRLFGFLEKTNPSIQTLNTLSNYLVFNSYSNYKNNKTNFDDWYFQQYLLRIKKLKKIGSTEILHIQNGIHYENNIVYFAYFLNYFIEKNNVSLLIEFFKNIDLKNINGSQSQKFNAIISTSLASVSEKKALAIFEKLIPFDGFRNNIPLLHVDYTGLQSIYFQVLQLIEKNNANSSDVFFVSLMKQYKAYYIDNSSEALPDLIKPKDYADFFGVLKGRFYGCCLLFNQHNLHKLKNEILVECNKNKVSLFLVEIIPALIITNEYSFLKKVLDRYYEEVFEHDVWSSVTTNSIYLIGLANVNWHSQNTQMAKRNLELVELEKIEIGYYDYIALFYHLITLKISYSENNKKANATALKTLQQLIKKTKFIRFEEKAARYVLR